MNRYRECKDVKVGKRDMVRIVDKLDTLFEPKQVYVVTMKQNGDIDNYGNCESLSPITVEEVKNRVQHLLTDIDYIMSKFVKEEPKENENGEI